VSHGKPGSALPSTLGERSVPTQRRVVALCGVLVGVVVVVAVGATLGGWVAALSAGLGAAGLVYASGIELACRRYGHAVDCVSGTFCECERCGRPMGDG